MATLRKFIDIGANLTDLMYMGLYNGNKKHEGDLKQVLDRAWANGLDKIIITAGNYQESLKAIDLTKTDDRLFCTVGCHPTRCLEFEEETPEVYLEKLRDLIRGNDRVVAIGECGLDYDRVQFCPKQVQKKYFELQLSLCENSDLPLFLHCRNAAADLLEILQRFRLKGVIHSFDGTLDEAHKFIDLGYYIGLNGCSLKTAQNLETVAKLPTDKILIETDCPWCEIRPSHAGYRLIDKCHQFDSVKKEKWSGDCMVKSRNEPANIVQVLDVIAGTKQEDRDKLCAEIYATTAKLFFPET